MKYWFTIGLADPDSRTAFWVWLCCFCFASALHVMGYSLIWPHYQSFVKHSLPNARYVSRVTEFQKQSFQHLAMFFSSTWWGDCKNMQEIEIPWWLFELPARLHSLFSPSGNTFMPCVGQPSTSHFDSSISCILLQSSNRHEKHFQMLERLFAIFHISRNLAYSRAQVKN